MLTLMVDVRHQILNQIFENIQDQEQVLRQRTGAGLLAKSALFENIQINPSNHI
jgi:hypothetical protein